MTKCYKCGEDWTNENRVETPLLCPKCRAVELFKCDTARISSPCGRHFLILGWNKNTKTEREAGRDKGQWVKTDENGVNTPFDFDFVHEQVIASGATLKEMWASAEHYKRLCDIHNVECYTHP